MKFRNIINVLCFQFLLCLATFAHHAVYDLNSCRDEYLRLRNVHQIARQRLLCSSLSRQALLFYFFEISAESSLWKSFIKSLPSSWRSFHSSTLVLHVSLFLFNLVYILLCFGKENRKDFKGRLNDEVDKAHLGLGQVDVSPVVEVADGKAELFLVVALDEELFVDEASPHVGLVPLLRRVREVGHVECHAH